MRSLASRDFDEPVRVRTVLRPDYQDQVRPGRNGLHGHLPVLGGVTNVGTCGRNDLRESLLQAVDDRCGVVQAERGLRDVDNAIRLYAFEGVDIFYAGYQVHRVGRLAESARHFVMVAMPDQND